MSDKTQIEFTLEIVEDTRDGIKKVRMRKYMYANFVPQHGMEIVDSGVIFKVKSIALAGLSGLSHVAIPEHIRQNSHLHRRANYKDEKWLANLVVTFKNQGWSVVE